MTEALADHDPSRTPLESAGADLAGRMTTITVQIPGKRAHDIVVGVDILDELPRRIAALGLARDILIISSPRIYGLYGERLRAVLEAGGCGQVLHVLFPDGEEHKNLATFQRLCEEVHHVEDRGGTKVLIVNLGGGVVGDVGGFVAATYERGRDYIQLPTTLLGDVDCGIGGKTGINHLGKNLIGAFHQPRLVLAELSFLPTLAPREVGCGLSEVIKYGVALDAEVFAFLQAHVREAVALDLAVIRPLVNRSFELKARIVEQDERDTLGIRAKLNFGHTVGHALEAATSYGAYAHGEAVAVGMVCACEIAERLGMFTQAQTAQVEALCADVGLPTYMAGADLDEIMRVMRHDKKFIGGKNRFVLPVAIGASVLKTEIDDGLIRSVLRGRLRSA